MRDQRVPCPDLREQELIANFLEQATLHIDRLSDSVELAIGRLNEYRHALINAAVTGNIDVREAAE